jgi:hypothetical protein
LDRVLEKAELHEAKVEREDCGCNHEPHHDPREIGSGERGEDQAHEGACEIGKDFVDFLIDTHRLLGGSGRGKNGCDKCQQPEF